MSRSVVIAISVAIAQLGCHASESIAPLNVSELRAVPLVARVEGKNLILSPYLYRDFQPVAPPDGEPLIAGLRIFAADSSAIPANITVDAVWVVYGDEIWAAPVGEARFEHSAPPFYEGIARDGPKWGPSIRVDVIFSTDSSTSSIGNPACECISASP